MNDTTTIVDGQTDIFVKVQKMRAETALTCEDMALSDGTIIYTKEQGLELLALYDELLDANKHQAGVAGVDPK